MGMTNDLPAAKCLRSGIVGGCRVGEGTGNEIGNLHLDGESGIGSNVFARLRRDNNGGNHICGRWYISHDW